MAGVRVLETLVVIMVIRILDSGGCSTFMLLTTDEHTPEPGLSASSHRVELERSWILGSSISRQSDTRFPLLEAAGFVPELRVPASAGSCPSQHAPRSYRAHPIPISKDHEATPEDVLALSVYGLFVLHVDVIEDNNTGDGKYCFVEFQSVQDVEYTLGNKGWILPNIARGFNLTPSKEDDFGYNRWAST
ncbi:hypothetical protein CONLIGDRAFT_670597 [Coniochaeta ligniaria NRRL 30616]|uniref:RRM domain-containing protein n=1 Tax=Coniochaeta ligniaria NRRL 30616 TaxID=1408157 RepID=A0A1J7IMY7_9PEZI|nr:hypothetical protein CONLIGDRAFT_670597 [Coniochaeta ligniaria NRRL 30616]